jgi:hypothetical protein
MGQKERNQKERCEEEIGEIGYIVSNPTGYRMQSPERSSRKDAQGIKEKPSRKTVKKVCIQQVEENRYPVIRKRFDPEARYHQSHEA